MQLRRTKLKEDGNAVVYVLLIDTALFSFGCSPLKDSYHSLSRKVDRQCLAMLPIQNLLAGK